MVHHTVFSRFNVVARNHAGFNSLLKAAEEAGIIEVIRPKGRAAPQKTVQPRPLWRRKRANSAPTEGDGESMAARLRRREDRHSADEVTDSPTRLRPREGRNNPDEATDSPKEVKMGKDVLRSIVKSKKSMVLRRRRRRFQPTKKANRQTKRMTHLSKAPMKTDREDVSADDFQFKDLDWSSWKIAIAPKTVKKQLALTKWAPRRDGPGLRNLGLFRGDTDAPAVYEFAVQPPGSKDKHAVQFKTTKGFSKGSWDAKLLNDLPTERQLDRVIRRGCKVYARRARLSLPTKNGKTDCKPLDELKSLIGQTYDYAWRQHYQVDTRRYVHRNVTVDGIKISDNPDWRKI